MGCRFVLQADNNPKCGATSSWELTTRKRWKTLEWPSQSPDLKPTEEVKLHSKRPRKKAELNEKAKQAMGEPPL